MDSSSRTLFKTLLTVFIQNVRLTKGALHFPSSETISNFQTDKIQNIIRLSNFYFVLEWKINFRKCLLLRFDRLIGFIFVEMIRETDFSRLKYIFFTVISYRKKMPLNTGSGNYIEL